MQISPVTLRVAKAFISRHHRHNKPPVGHKFSIGLINDAGELIGVATAGRPVARHLDDGLTLEVNRTCTTGERNANSALYGASGGQQKLWVINVVLRTPGQMNQEHLFAQLVLFV